MIALLTSGVTLGTHVPALILAQRLRAAGSTVTVEVFERLLRRAELDKLRAAKVEFRADFKVAVTAQRMARDQSPAFDDGAVGELLGRWRAAGVRTVVVFSGLWVPVVERYLTGTGAGTRVDVCHLDSADTASFRLFADRTAGWRHLWMFTDGPDPVPLSIPVSDAAPVPWERRPRRVLAHGGGWGLGTYRTRATDIAAAGIEVDVVAHATGDLDGVPAGLRHFMVDPAWEAWTDGGFAPFGEVRDGGPPRYRRGTDHHDSFDLARHSAAMVCKTGGGSLLDSLWAATPIVLLEPFGAHEKANALLWQRLGFGLTFDEWRDGGFSLAPLERMHHNLLRVREGVPDYTADLLETPS
jgi:hypothetical protein